MSVEITQLFVAMGKAAMKRPAARKAAKKPEAMEVKVEQQAKPEAALHGQGAEDKDPDIAMATGMVRPGATVQLLREAAGLLRTNKSDELVWASAFDGTGMPSYALKLLSVPARQLYGSESAPGPAYHLLKNLEFRSQNGHLFKDWCYPAGIGFEICSCLVYS